MVSASLIGSEPSRAGGMREVLTEQKRHPRVHVSPISIKVAVPLFQHSPIFGHLASSHTVLSFRFRDLSRIQL